MRKKIRMTEEMTNRKIFEQYCSVLSESLLFRNFETEEIIESISKADPEILTVKKNDMILLPEKLGDIFLVLSGRFNVIQDSGMNVSLAHMLLPGRCFGIAFCSEGIPCRHRLQAAENSEALRLSYERLTGQETMKVRFLENLLAR